MRALIALAALGAAGCATDVPEPIDGRADPIAFFTGVTRGAGELDVLFRRPVPIEVSSRGRPDRAGGIVLDQRIIEGSKAPRVRRWHLRPDGPNRFTGSLTDADGPVRMEVRGGRVHVEYRMRNGMAVNQWLTLLPDGRTIDNRMSIRRFGITLATIEEIILKP